MLKFKAEDYGLEPNVTGIEEEINLAYLDGEREGFDDAKLEDVRNLIKLGSDDEFISKSTGLDLDKIRSLRWMFVLTFIFFLFFVMIDGVVDIIGNFEYGKLL